MRNRVLYLNPTKTERALDNLARDVMRLKRFFTDQLRFVRNYLGYRRDGYPHSAAVSNARNAI
jgi:hypothetical protein